MATHSHSHGPDHDHGHDHGHYHPPHDSGPPPSFSDPGAESLNQALRSGFNVLRIIMLVLIVAYIYRGVFQVFPNEQGLIVRFGRLRENDAPTTGIPSRYVFGPGSHYALPDPFDQKIRVSIAPDNVEVQSFVFARSPEARDRPLETTVPQREKLMPTVDGAILSGDQNLSHGTLEIEYRIADAEKFVRNVGEKPEQARGLIRPLAENAMTRVAAGLPVERLLRRGKPGEIVIDFVIDVKKRLNEELDALNTGIIVDKVSSVTIEPGIVRSAFLSVSRSQQESEDTINIARTERVATLGSAAGAQDKYESLLKAIDEYGAAQTVGDDNAKLAALRDAIDVQLDTAEGEVARMLNEARAEASIRRDRVQSEYLSFLQHRDAFRKFPVLTAVRLWVAMRNTILGSRDNELFYVPKTGEIEIITNRNEERAKEIETDNLKKKPQ
jgi:regulator of protease activity HflC (stomatin/prohibitin superfamily)